MSNTQYDTIQIPLLSLADMCRELAQITGSRIIDHEGKYITYANKGMLYGRNFIIEADAAELKAILREIREGLAQGLPGGISFTQERMPADFEEVLKENGFVKFISQIGMIFELEKGFPQPEPSMDAHIQPIGKDRLTDWCATNSEAFPKPREDETFEALIKSDRLLTYGYMLDDAVASTGMLLLHPELSGIHEISTRPEYRRKGQIRTMICHMLEELQNRGIGSVSLQASDAGRMVYEPLGFEAVSTIPTWVPGR